MRLEKDLMKQVSQRLAIYKMIGQVAWYVRLQSGKAKVGSYYINLSDPGTPDWIVLVNGKDRLLALFIECKSEKGTIRDNQLTFMKKYQDHPFISVLVIKDIDKLHQFIDLYAGDVLKKMDDFSLE